MRIMLVASALTLIVSTGVAQALTVTGSEWDGVTLNATFANIPVAPVSNTFTVTSPLTMNSCSPAANCSPTYIPGGNNLAFYTLFSWLNSNGSVGSLGNPANNGNTMNNTFWLITGLVNLTGITSFTVTHDDGYTLQLGTGAGSETFSNPGPSAPTTDTNANSLTGIQPFKLVYSEMDGAPAVLQISLPLSVPGPIAGAGLPGLIAACGGLIALARRRRRHMSA